MFKLDRRQALGLMAAGVATRAAAQAPQVAPGTFGYGVASGDPLADRVVIWTCAPQGASTVRWEMAEDEAFTQLAAKGEATPNSGGTVKADVTGLKPGRDYFYRFMADEAVSPTGRARTLSEGPTPDVVLAVASCALWAGGFYNAYQAIADLERVDAVVHLGDYIYEYGADGYGGDIGAKIGRIPDPPTECLTLADYRRRHAQAKADPQLQAAHARAPWIVVWDDHETANDSWVGGAENHQPDKEGAWSDRKAAALQAWYEWMPIRDPEPGRAFEAINRSFQFGDLASLIMVETRLTARSHQLEYETDLPVVDGKPDVAAFMAKWTDPDRTLMGEKQMDWLAGELAASVQAGRRWQVLGNQIVMARVAMPDIQAAMGEAAFAQMLAGQTPYVQARLKESVGLAKMGLPANLDAWDGYPAARERVLGACKAAGAKPLVLSGDSHAFWANELWDEAGETRVAAEFATTGITSPGFGDILPGAPLGAAFEGRNREVVYNDQAAKGFILLTLTPQKATGEYVAVSTIFAPAYETTVLKSFDVEPAEKGVGPLTLTDPFPTLAAAE